MRDLLYAFALAACGEAKQIPHRVRDDMILLGRRAGMGWNEREYFVYMLASRSRALYVGMTNDLQRRVWEHRNGAVEGFTRRYNIHRLVWFESGSDVGAAIGREKQLKGWRREKKIALIEEGNPTWEDLAEGWFDGSRSEKQIPHFVRDDNETFERNDSGERAKDQSFGS